MSITPHPAGVFLRLHGVRIATDAGRVGVSVHECGAMLTPETAEAMADALVDAARIAREKALPASECSACHTLNATVRVVCYAHGGAGAKIACPTCGREWWIEDEEALR